MKYQRSYKKLIILIAINLIILTLVIFCPEMQKSVPLSFLAGMFTCVLTVILIDLVETARLYNALKDLSSKNWTGFAVSNRQAIKHKTESGREFNSFAEIEHIQDNILHVTLTHDTDPPDTKKTWQGIIEINRQSLNSGLLTFKYEHNLEAAAKQVLIHRETDRIYIYLIPLNNTVFTFRQVDKLIIPTYDHGIEVLIKQK